MKLTIKTLLITLLVLGFSAINTEACTRVTYTMPSDVVITGRTMDWQSEEHPKMVLFQRGELRSAKTVNPIKWKSKYGSVAIMSADKLLNSGMNEKGLEADVLWLDAANYGQVKNNQKTLDANMFLQYFLDNFATVDEAVNFIKTNKLIPAQLEKVASVDIKLHYILTDKTGNNVIVEYVNGEQKIYPQKGRIVLTNDPTYDKMLAIKNYYSQVGILRNMPGSSLSEARFVYASGWLENFTDKSLTGYLKGITNHDLDTQAVMSVLSLMRGVSTPLGVEFSMAEPNNTSTLWRTVGDLKNNMFYFDSALSMTTIWVDLNKLDFTKGNKSIDLSNGVILHGDVTDKFQ